MMNRVAPPDSSPSRKRHESMPIPSRAQTGFYTSAKAKNRNINTKKIR
jgi:hypothetical protein